MGGKMFRSLICNWRRCNDPTKVEAGAAGFTLIEVMVALVLITTLTLTALPFFREWAQQNLAKAAARDVVNLLYKARSLAVSRNLEHHVECDFDNNDCVLEVKEDGTWTGVPGGRIGFPVSIDLRGTLNCDVVSGTGLIEFNPNGTCNQLYFCITELNSGDAYKVGTSDSVTSRIVVNQ